MAESPHLNALKDVFPCAEDLGRERRGWEPSPEPCSSPAWLAWTLLVPEPWFPCVEKNRGCMMETNPQALPASCRAGLFDSPARSAHVP